MTDLKEVDYYLASKWTTIEWECPYCGKKNKEDYDTFDSDDIWYGFPTTECSNCGAEVKLRDKDYG